MKPNVLVNRRLLTPLILRMLFILFFIEFIKGALLVTVLPVYMNVILGLPAFTVGVALAMQYAGDNLFRTPMGWLVDRIGYRTGIVAGGIVTGLSLWIMARATDAPWMITAAALLGVGTSPLWPSVISGATSEAGESARGTVMSIVYAVWLTGTGLGPVAINLFIHDRSYMAAFWMLAGILAVVMAVSLFLPNKQAKGGRAADSVMGMKGENGSGQIGQANGEIRSNVTGDVKEANSSKLADRAKAARLDDWSLSALVQRLIDYIKRVRSTIQVSRLFYLALFVQNLSIGLLAPVLTLYAKEVLQLSNQMYSLLLVIGGGITVVLLYPFGKLADRWGTRWILHIGLAMSGSAIILFSWIRSLTAVWLVVGWIGLSYALVIPAWNALIASYVPEDRRALVWGFFLTIEGGGMVTGSVISGQLWDSFGPQAPFLLSGAAMWTLFVLHLFISKPQNIMVR